MSTIIDHLVVVAPNLTTGTRFVENALGVRLRQGGKHPRMGTHNRLLSLGDSTYLEVIAPDPAAPRPDRPRWFGLDQLVSDSPPRLGAWVVRADDIHASSADCASVVGCIEPMSRGALSWLITVPSDGALPLGGAAPALIEWRSEPHPARTLDDAGCALVELEIFHPDPRRVESVLTAIDLESAPRIQPLRATAEPYLVAHFQTLAGRRTLSGAQPRPIRMP